MLYIRTFEIRSIAFLPNMATESVLFQDSRDRKRNTHTFRKLLQLNAIPLISPHIASGSSISLTAGTKIGECQKDGLKRSLKLADWGRIRRTTHLVVVAVLLLIPAGHDPALTKERMPRHGKGSFQKQHTCNSCL